MNRSHGVAIAVASAVAVGGSVYTLAVRPWIDRWGATDGPVGTPRPADEFESPHLHRAISSRRTGVDAPPDEVWPWLA